MHENLIICKNCHHQFTGNYCNNCGEKVYTEKDRHLGHFVEEGVHFITHFDGKFFTTLKTLFTKPGQVSLDYTEGVRKKYFKLLSLFLLMVILYLLFPFFEGLNMKLYYHEQHMIYGKYAKERVLHIMRDRQLSESAVSDLFHKSSEKVSKTLLLLIIPLTALALWPVTYRRRKYFFDQMVFSTEVSSMYLLWGFLLLPLLVWGINWTVWAFGGRMVWQESWIGLIMSVPLAFFAGRAGGRFYELNRWQSVLFGLFYIVVNVIVVHYIYKFILFVTVINSI